MSSRSSISGAFMGEIFFDGTVLVRQRSLPSYRKPLFEELARRCKRLVLVTSRSPTEESMIESDQWDGGQWIRLKGCSLGKGVALVYWQQGLIDVVNEMKPDIILTEANPRFLDTGKLRRWTQKHHKPLVGWGLGTTNFFGHGFDSIRKWRRAQTLARFDGLIAYGSVAKTQYVEDFGFDASRIFVAHNATANVPDSESLDQPHRTATFSDASPFRVITIGRLIAQKKIELILGAISMLRQSGLHVEVVLVGDGNHREVLRDLAQEQEVPVRFAGHLEGDALRNECEKADLFVLPGLGGLAIQQAMSFGLPVVVSNADGTEADLVRGNGWVIPPDSCDSLASTIRAAYENPYVTREMGLESRRIVQEEINIGTMADKMIDALCQLSQLQQADSKDRSRPNLESFSN